MANKETKPIRGNASSANLGFEVQLWAVANALRLPASPACRWMLADQHPARPAGKRVVAGGPIYAHP